MLNTQQLYNKYGRNKKAKQFYNSKAWEVCRTQALRRDYYLCQHCLANKVIRVYDAVHHIKPMLLYPELSLVLDNLISLCHSCHKKAESNADIKDRDINVIEVEVNQAIT